MLQAESKQQPSLQHVDCQEESHIFYYRSSEFLLVLSAQKL